VFQTHSEYKVMTFGLSGAPATFQGAMNATLKSCPARCVLVFFSDILIYSLPFEQQLRDLREVLALLRKQQLQDLSEVLALLCKDHWLGKESKCEFAQQQVSYLGHIISAEGVGTDPSKISDVQKWKTPPNVKELRKFLGLAGYYRKFVHHFGILVRPIRNSPSTQQSL
jgi:hypothetical protein